MKFNNIVLTKLGFDDVPLPSLFEGKPISREESLAKLQMVISKTKQRVKGYTYDPNTIGDVHPHFPTHIEVDESSRGSAWRISIQKYRGDIVIYSPENPRVPDPIVKKQSITAAELAGQ